MKTIGMHLMLFFIALVNRQRYFPVLWSVYDSHRTSQNFLMILATNRPSDLDSAITDRVDEVLNFDHPKQPERVWMSFVS